MLHRHTPIPPRSHPSAPFRCPGGARVLLLVASLAGVTSSRFEIYRNSLMLAGDYLFTGIGVGDTFAMVYSRYSLMIFVPLFTYTHNLFLAILLGQGIFGLVAFIIVMLTFYLFVVRVLWVVRITEIEPLFYGALIGVTATFVHGLTDARQYVESPFNLPLLFAGMALTVACGINALRAEAFEDRTTNQGRGWGTLKLMHKKPGLHNVQLGEVGLNLSLDGAFGPARRRIAYERMLLDVLHNNSALFVRRDEVDAAWKWIDGIIDGWRSTGQIPKPYSAGSWGPSAAIGLPERFGHSWHE